jgi:hypothetical protein
MSLEQAPLLGNSSYKPSSKPSSATPPLNALATEDNLTKFRVAIGINVDETIFADLESGKKGPRGLYKEIIAIQRSRYLQYQAVEALYYVAIIVQILIGAFLASLGSLPTLHPILVTALGIANTFTAGILALLKGQGLPDRLRKDEFQMKKVQDFIEETEIRLAVAGGGSWTAEELDSAMEQIFDKYNSARDTAEMNRPSSYAHQVENGMSGDRDGSGDGDRRFGSLRAITKRSTNSQNDNDGGRGKKKLIID